MKKTLASILCAAFVTGMTVSCDDYLDVNTNQDAPDYVDAGLYLPGILSAYQGFYWDIRALGPLAQMLGTSSYTNFANNYYSAASDAAGEMWRVNYWLQGMNLENMINQSIEDEAWTLVGIGYAIKAFSWDFIAKYHCEAPMKQAYVSGLLSHDYDYQWDIMAQVREWAQTAIEYLEMDDEFEYGTYLSDGDLVYHGDKSKWIKFAHSIIVSDLIALSNKTDFVADYAPMLLEHAALAMDSNDDTFAVERGGGGEDAQFSVYNNFWGTYRGNLYNYYWQSDYIVQILTGTVPLYDESGDKVDTENVDEDGNELDANFPWALNPEQVIADTSDVAGHYDPRAAAYLSTADGAYYKDMDNVDSIKSWVYYGSGFVSSTGPIGTAPNLYGWRATNPSTSIEGTGRWLFRDDAPYILMNAAEIKFDVAECYWKMGDKDKALAAWKEGVALSLEFAGDWLNPGAPLLEDGEYVSGGSKPGGSMIAAATYDALAEEYLAGPYVGEVNASTLTLSNIMMQKYVALWPWGAIEAWTDLRKYHFDINYTGDYPSLNNGWSLTLVDQKRDEDETKVYKGFYLRPADVEDRRISYNSKNEGSPAYRVRPRYNSEYMWNKSSLEALVPISGMADNYHCSIPWFAYPGDMPTSL